MDAADTTRSRRDDHQHAPSRSTDPSEPVTGFGARRPRSSGTGRPSELQGETKRATPPRSLLAASRTNPARPVAGAAWQPRRPPLDRRNSPARPRPIHAVSDAPSAIDKLASAGGRRHHPGRPVPAAGCSGRRTSERRGRTRSRVDPSAAGARRRRSPPSTWGRLGDHSSVSQPSGVDCAGLRLVAERSLG